MSVEHLVTTADASEWRTVLPASTSVFGSVEFARIKEIYQGYQARLYIRDTANEKIVYPFFLRPIRALPFAQDLADELWDSLTPEYTGPLQFNNESNTETLDFADQFSAYCRSQGIVTEFAHLHPWRSHFNSLDADHISLDREIIYVDLTRTIDQLWEESYSYACRKNINRAKREGVRVFEATTLDHIRGFSRIYSHTMTRNDAPKRYHFPTGYFANFFTTMPDNARFMLAEYEDQIIAGTLYLHDDQDVYSYLGGADQDFQHLRPTNAIIHETVKWAQDARKQRLILGGGYRENDGIFRFKSSFSPLRARFHIYRRIHLTELYERLCKVWSSHYQCELAETTYFPAYRSQPATASSPDE